MKLSSHEFTSESVSEGHPDKVADQVSDAVVDLFLAKDPTAKVAVETLTTTNKIVLAGEVRTNNGAVVSEEEMNEAARAVVKRYRVRTGRLPLAEPERSTISSTASPPRSRRVLSQARACSRKKAPVTRASCSVTRPTRRRS
jgi:hypothetical protein